MKNTCLIGLFLPLIALSVSACGTGDGGSGTSSGAGGDATSGTGASATSTSGSGGAGGATGSGGTPTSGAGGTTGSGGTASTSSSSGAGGGSVKCSAPSDCAGDEVCDFPDDMCGKGAAGTCLPRPQACTQDCPMVCGCDGMNHCNGCIAHSKGVDVSATPICGSANVKYSAQFWPGGLDHILLWKADITKNLCFEVHLAWPSQNQPGFNVTLPAMWGVMNAMVTDNAQNCGPNMTPTGQTFNATSGTGTAAWVLQPGMYAPCDVDFHLNLTFAGAPAWVPPTEPLDADNVTVGGGCI